MYELRSLGARWVRSRGLAPRLARAAIGGVVAAAAALVVPGVAQAYSHDQPCFQAPYSQCYDAQGILYNPWGLVNTQMDDFNTVPEICAKARSQAGTTKSGSACAGGSWTVTACISASPISNAYGYWGDGGCHCWSARYFHVYAET